MVQCLLLLGVLAWHVRRNLRLTHSPLRRVCWTGLAANTGLGLLVLCCAVENYLEFPQAIFVPLAALHAGDFPSPGRFGGGIVTTNIRSMGSGMTTAADNQLGRAIPVSQWALPAVLVGKTARLGMLSLVDQVIVSGTRFLTTVIVGRACGADELGVYALGFSLLIFLTVLQETLITTPYTILGSGQTDRRRAHYAGSLLIHHGVLLLLVFALLLLAGAVGTWGASSPMWATVLWALAASLPFALLREFARRFAFAHMRVAAALTVDAAVAVMQVGGVVLLAGSGELTAASALLVMGLACALASSVWLYACRDRFLPRPRNLWPHLVQDWAFGKWLFGSQMVGVVSHYSVFWLLSILISTAATGIYSACSTVVMLSNPFILGLCNVLEPRTARAFVEGGKPELLRVVRKATVVLAIFLGLFWWLVFFAGERIVTWLYHNPAFEGHGQIIVVLTTSLVIASLGIVYANGLKAMGHPAWNLHASLLDLLVTLSTAVPLACCFGMVGGAYCLLCGAVTGFLARYLAFTHLIGRAD